MCLAECVTLFAACCVCSFCTCTVRCAQRCMQHAKLAKHIRASEQTPGKAACMLHMLPVANRFVLLLFGRLRQWFWHQADQNPDRTTCSMLCKVMQSFYSHQDAQLCIRFHCLHVHAAVFAVAFVCCTCLLRAQRHARTSASQYTSFMLRNRHQTGIQLQICSSMFICHAGSHLCIAFAQTWSRHQAPNVEP